MARPVKKPSEQWKSEIIMVAKKLFMSKGYEATSITDIMEEVGGAKGMFYRFFQGKEEVMHELGDQMFFESNPFEAVKARTDLNGLQKIRELLILNQGDTERSDMNVQAIPILKDPHILVAAIDANRRILTPLWFELLTEGIQDGSIQTKYSKELSELLPLINFWLMPSIYPDTPAGLRHKFEFIIEALAKMGLPLFNDDEMLAIADNFLAAISPEK